MTPPSLPPLPVLIDKDDVVLASTEALLKKANEACVEPDPKGFTDAHWDHWTAGYLGCVAGKLLKPGVPLLDKEGKIYLSTGTEHFMSSPRDKEGVGILSLKTPELLNQIEFLPGAKESITSLVQAQGINPFFVTAIYPPERGAEEKAWKKALVEQHFPTLKEKLHFDTDKTRYAAEVMIDDGAHNHQAFRDAAAKKGLAVLSLLVNREMNKNEELPGVVRVDSLAEAAFIVAQVAEQRRRDFEGVKRLPGGDPALALKVPQHTLEKA